MNGGAFFLSLQSCLSISQFPIEIYLFKITFDSHLLFKHKYRLLFSLNAELEMYTNSVRFYIFKWAIFFFLLDCFPVYRGCAQIEPKYHLLTFIALIYCSFSTILSCSGQNILSPSLKNILFSVPGVTNPFGMGYLFNPYAAAYANGAAQLVSK